MNHALNIPPNSIYLTSVLTTFLCLINLGSNFAFNIIVSLSLLALLSTYMISIGCVMLKRIRGEPLPHARWSLGRWGLPINAFAFAYSGFVMVWSCFPSAVPVTTGSANVSFSFFLLSFLSVEVGVGWSSCSIWNAGGTSSRWNSANMDTVGSCSLGRRYSSVRYYICRSWKEVLYTTCSVCGGQESERYLAGSRLILVYK